MSMSKESKAKMAALQSSEWSKFMKSYQASAKAYAADKKAAEVETQKEYDLMAGLAQFFFTMSSMITGGHKNKETGEGMPGWQQLLLNTAAAGAGAVVGDLSSNKAEQSIETLKTAGYDVYNPLVNTIRAGELEWELQADKDATVTAFDSYNTDSWKGIGMSTLTQAGSWLGSEATTGGIDDFTGSADWDWLSQYINKFTDDA